MRYLPRLDEAEVREACAQTHPFWGKEKSRDDHAGFSLRQLAQAGPELLRYVGLVDEEGGLVASLKRYSLALTAPARAGGVLRTVGIGAVFTRPDARRRGHASELVREVVREAEDLGYEAAWLWSDIGPELYERIGFVALPALEHTAKVASLPSEGALATRAVSEPSEERLRELYDASFDPAARWLRPSRSRATHRYFRWRNAVRGERALVDGGREVGYVVAQPVAAKHSLWVDEWSAPDVPLERVYATLRAIAEREDMRSVSGWLRPDVARPPFVASQRKESLPMVLALGRSWVVDAVPADHAHFGSIDHF